MKQSKHILSIRMFSVFLAVLLSVESFPQTAFAHEIMSADDGSEALQEVYAPSDSDEALQEVYAPSDSDEDMQEVYALSDSDEVLLGETDLYGGSVSCGGVTAVAVSEENYGNETESYKSIQVNVELSSDNGESVYYFDYDCYLYSPSRKVFAPTGISYGSEEYASSLLDDDYGEKVTGRIIYRQEIGNEISDYQLVLFHMLNDNNMIGGIMADAPNSLDDSIVSGKYNVEILGTNDESGVHSFFLYGSLVEETERYSVRTTGSGSDFDTETHMFTYKVPDELPRACTLGMCHVFYGKDGTFKIRGVPEGDRFIAAAYSAGGRMVKVNELTRSEDDNSKDPVIETYLGKIENGGFYRLYGLDGNFAPLDIDFERPEIAQVKEAQVGQPDSRGSATVSIDGTDSTGSVTIQAAKVGQPFEDARTISVVDVSMEDGELDGVAEIRIVYEGIDEKGYYKKIKPTQLLPGYYNEETAQWETPIYYVDEVTKEVVILTDHFSRYGLFEVEASGTPSAFMVPMDPCQLAQMDADTAVGILSAAKDKSDNDLLGYILEALSGNKANAGIASASLVGGIMQCMEKHAAIGDKLGTTMNVLGVGAAALKVISCVYNDISRGEVSNRWWYALEDMVVITGGGMATSAMASAVHPVVGALVCTYYLGTAIYDAYYEYVEAEKMESAEKIFNELFLRYIKDTGGASGQKEWEEFINRIYDRHLKNSTVESVGDDYKDFDKDVYKLIHGYAFCFYEDFKSGRIADIYGKQYKVPDNTDNSMLELARIYSKDFEARIYKMLGPLFKKYSNQTYFQAAKRLKEIWANEADLMNLKITLNFKEKGGQELTKDCYVRFFDGESGDWKADFDNYGNARMSFTAFAYAEMGAPRSISVLNKKDGSAVGKIDLPEELWTNPYPGGLTFDIEFDPGAFVKEIEIEEEPDPDGTYRYAGHIARLVPLAEGIEETDPQQSRYTYRILLNEQGYSKITLSSDAYNEMGAPDRIEILSEDESSVIYSAPFSFAQDTVVLRHDMCLVNISCSDEKAVEYYSGMTATFAYVDDNHTHVSHDQCFIDDNGHAVLMISRSLLDYYYGQCLVYVSKEGSADPIAVAMGVVTPEYQTEIFFDDDIIAKDVILIRPDEDEDEYLTVEQDFFEMEEGNVAFIPIKSGYIGRSESKDHDIARESEDIIIAGKVGQTVITLYDKYHDENVIELKIRVSKKSETMGNGWGAFYKAYTTYSYMVAPVTGKETIHTERIYDGWVYLSCSYGIRDGIVGITGVNSVVMKKNGTYESNSFRFSENASFYDGYRLYDRNLGITYLVPAGMDDASFFKEYTHMELGHEGYADTQGVLIYVPGVTSWDDIGGYSGADIDNESESGLDSLQISSMSGMDITDPVFEGTTADDYDATVSDENNRFELSYNEAVRGKKYAMYVVAGDETELAGLTPEDIELKLLYIDEKMAEDDTLSFSYIPRRQGKASVYLAENGGRPVLVDTIEGEEETETYQVVFDPNEGTGEMSPQMITVGEETALSPNTFFREGYRFAGWGLVPVCYSEADRIIYEDNQVVKDLTKPTRSVTLYAQWEKDWFELFLPDHVEAFADGKQVEKEGALIKPGTVVNIKYVPYTDDLSFRNWKTDSDINIADSCAQETSFIMPAYPVWISYEEDKKEDVAGERIPDDYEKYLGIKVAKVKFPKSVVTVHVGGIVGNMANVKAAKNIIPPYVAYVTSNRNIAEVDKEGTIKAMGAGKATITAYCGNKKTVCKVNVILPTKDISIVDMKGNDYTWTDLALKGGEQAVLRVTFNPEGTTDNRKVTWKSSNSKVVSVKNGVITAKEVKEKQEATLSATVKYTDLSSQKPKQKTITRTVTVKVSPIVVPKNSAVDKTHALSLKKSSVKLVIGDEYDLVAVLTPKDKKTQGVDYELVNVSSTNEAVVSVKSVGELSPAGKKTEASVKIEAIGNGTAYIVVQSKKKGTEEALNLRRMKVQVQSPVSGIVMKSNSLPFPAAGDGTVREITLRQGVYEALDYDLLPTDSTDISKVKWSASGGVTVKNGLIFTNKITKSGKPAKVMVKCGKASDYVRINVIP